jgi:hypothetical protein
MADREEIVIVRGTFSATEAMCVVATLTGDLDAKVDAEVIYPYHCFVANCSIPTLVGRKPMSMVCLVDAINGLGATADSFDFRPESVPANQVLEADVTVEEAKITARNTLTHSLGRKLRMISSFDVAIHNRGLIYKRYWIVSTGDARVMVDSTTGGMHPLKLRAA